jgi:glyoxylase-like metal-dependent hydrolase (beta-lactamase superfamily II)
MVTPRIQLFVLGEYQTNCFVVAAPGEVDCWIVDCGFDPEPMFNWIARQKLVPAALLLTHTHPDHIAGVDAAIDRFGAMPIYVHEAEAGFCSDPALNLSAAMGMPLKVTEPDHLLREGDTTSTTPRSRPSWATRCLPAPSAAWTFPPPTRRR